MESPADWNISSRSFACEPGASSSGALCVNRLLDGLGLIEAPVSTGACPEWSEGLPKPGQCHQI